MSTRRSAVPRRPVYEYVRTYRKAAPKKKKAPKAVSNSYRVGGKGKAVEALNRDIEQLSLSDRIRSLPGYGAASSILPNTISTLGHMGLKFLTGVGAYKFQENSIMHMMSPKSVNSSPVPYMVNPGFTGNARIRKREYVQDIYSSTSFQNISFGINPANATLFKWLSQIAQCYQEYKFHGLVFEFVSTSADALNSTNTALGSICLSTDYNAASAAFTTKAQAENADFSSSAKPSECVMHGVECASSMTINNGHLYISGNNNGTAPSGEDIKTYNLGLFQVVTTGSQAAANIGELYVTYDVEFFKTSDNGILSGSTADHWYITDCGNGNSNYLLGQGAPVSKFANLGTSLTVASADSKITFPASVSPGQKFMISYAINGSASTSQAQTGTITYTNCTALQILNNGAYTAFGSTGASAQYFMMEVIIQISASADQNNRVAVDFTTGWIVPSASNGDLIITQLPGSFA